MTESNAADNLTFGKTRTSRLCSFGNVYYHSHFQGTSAARAFLSGGDAGVLTFEVYFRGYGVGAHWAVGHSLGAILMKGFHFFLLLTYSDASELPNVFENFVKISKRCPIAREEYE